LSDLDRRHAIEMHLDAYRMALADGKRPPKGMVIAPLTPRLHPLTPHQLLEVSTRGRMSAPFLFSPCFSCYFYFFFVYSGSTTAKKEQLTEIATLLASFCRLKSLNVVVHVALDVA